MGEKETNYSALFPTVAIILAKVNKGGCVELRILRTNTVYKVM